MSDIYAGRSAEQTMQPIIGGFAVTPSDSANLATFTRGIIVGVSGDVKVVLLDDSTVTLPALAAGVIHPVRAKKVFSTGTTATTIVALY